MGLTSGFLEFMLGLILGFLIEEIDVYRCIFDVLCDVLYWKI